MINVIIIDDEQQARMLLKNMLLELEAGIQVLAECGDLPNGIKNIRKLKPDVVFLDIEMPGHSGLEILDFFNEDEIDFEIVFTTAYNEFALQAFKLSAIDYLLKPIQPELIREAVNRVISKYNKTENILKFSALKQNLDVDNTKKIAVAIGQSIKFIDIDTIVFIKAEGAYSELVLKDESKILVSKNLKHFEDVLTISKNFIRVHKSYMINTQYVSEYVKSDGGYLILKEKYEVNITHDKVERLLQVLGAN
jgi:two-component system LytT family response regulator